MCGLFGWQISAEALEGGDLHTLAAVLAYNAEWRGDDSWGVCKLDSTGLSIVKEAGSIKKTCRVKTILAPQVIGHTRKATVGDKTKENSHPFHIGDIIGAHNGHVYDHSELNKKNNTKWQVDSQHLIAHIAAGKPISELSGSGTVSYLDTKHPNVVFLGRGLTSDLQIYGIGKEKERAKFDGIVWASVGTWVTQALEMAGWHEYTLITTYTSRLYKVSKHQLLEVEAFPFSMSREYPTGVQNTGTYNHACGYRGRTTWDDRKEDVDYWSKRAYGAEKNAAITKDDMDHLPPGLKKNPQVGVLEGGQGKEAEEETIQCDGCRHWGQASKSYESNADGIVECQEIGGQNLCYECYLWWGTETTGIVPVPILKMNLDERLLR